MKHRVCANILCDAWNRPAYLYSVVCVLLSAVCNLWIHILQMPDKGLNQAVRICKVLYRVEVHGTSWFTDMLNQTCKEFTTHNTGALVGLSNRRTEEAITYNFYIERANFY